MIRRIALPLFAAALLLWAVGCSNNPSDPQTDSDLPNISSDFGGYTATDEAPGFGNPDLVAQEGDEVEADDPMASSQQIEDWAIDPSVLAFHFRAIWGQLTYDSTVTTPTSWDGSLTISRGGVITRRLIAWELNQDFLLPRTDRKVVEWQSTTTVSHDGLAFDLLIPWVNTYDTTMTVDTTGEITYDTSIVVDTVDDTTFDTTIVVDTVDGTEFDTMYVVDTVPPEPFTLTFATGPYTRTFDMEELAALDTIVYVDDADSNAVAFQGYQYFRNVCPRGVLTGHWGYDEDGNGIFNGVWHSRFGYADGYVEGMFGLNEDSAKVFYGKWIDRSGSFEGLLAGTYGYGPNHHASDMGKMRAAGWLDGKIYDADENEIGVLKGKFKAHAHFPSGWFQARWKLNCATTGNEEPSLDDAL